MDTKNGTRPVRTFGALAAAVGLVVAASQPAVMQGIDATTVPVYVVGNRPFVDVELHGPGATARTARFLVDSGGGGFIITERIARALGLTWGDTIREEGRSFAVFSVPPAAVVGGLTLPVNPARALVLLGSDNVLSSAAPGSADGLIPGHLLARYHVVFDYPGGSLTIAAPGMLTPKGVASPMPVAPASGFPRTEITIDGTTYGFLLDTGASFTMVSDAVLKKWGAAHADWRRYPGAYGDAATLGGVTLETMFVPRARWGTQELGEFGLVSQPEGTFERQMSGQMTAPIVGSLAGNVLKNYRVDLDYPNQTLYLSKP